MRAFCYCRVSTEEQSTGDHYSLGNQEKKARDYAKFKDWRIVKVRKDVASGKDTNRSGFQELVSCVMGREIDVVLVYRLDRLSRNVRDVYDLLDLMKQHGVAFVSITEGFDTTTAMDRAMLGVAAVFAQLTREMIGENVKDGLLRRAESGKWNGPKWNPPYGYTYVVGGSIEPIPEQAELVRQIFRWFTQDRWGTMKIASALNGQGIVRESGKPGSGQWYQAKVWELLQNPVYVGYLAAGDKLVKGIHEPLIDPETWETAREIVASRRKQTPRSKASPYLLTGLVRCGKCGRAMVAQKARYKSHSGQKEYYAFRHSPNELAGDLHCPGVYHRGDTLEEAVVEKILDLARKPQVMENALSIARDRLDSEDGPVRDEITQTSGRIVELDRSFEEWADRLDRRIIDEAQFQNHNSVLLAEREKLTQRLTELQAKAREGEQIEVSLSHVQEMLGSTARVWKTLQFEERREVLQLLVDRVLVYPDHVTLHLFHLPAQEIIAERAGIRYRHKKEAAPRQISELSG